MGERERERECEREREREREMRDRERERERETTPSLPKTHVVLYKHKKCLKPGKC